MKGEKGVCSIGVGSAMIRRTKFDTESHAIEAMNNHKELGFIANDYVVYKCKVCEIWHFGKPEWKKIYEK